LAVSTLGRALPSIALIGVFIAWLGVTFLNVAVALVVLAVPPILTNTYLAVDGVDRDAVDAARGMGLTEAQILLRIELPLGLPLILAGIRIGAVFVIATATIAAVAGVTGGLGDIILNSASYGDAGVVAAALCVSAVAFATAGILGLARGAAFRRMSPNAQGLGKGNSRGGQMVRKHTRRAAKAAFAVSIGVALLIGLAAFAGSAKAKTTTSKPTITIGTKNFAEEYILGQIYGQALAAKGFHVVYKGSFGSSELADKAITSGKMNFYPEYTGVIALDLAKVKNAPKTAAATYTVAKNFEETRGLTLLKATPFYDTDTFTMLTKTAKRLHVKTISDMKGHPFTYAGYPECQTRITCILGMKKIYHLTNIKFIPIGTISVYTLL